MKDIIKKYRATGECELDIDEVVNQWTVLWFLSQWYDEYTIVTVRPDKRFKAQKKIVVKVSISTKQARDIIKRLNLVRIRDTIFNNAAVWKIKE